MKGERAGATIRETAEPDVAEQEVQVRATDRASRAADIAAAWGQIMQDLRDRKQVLTATVFQEGWPSSFDDEVLEVSFPQEPDFYLKEAKNPRHREALGEILEERFGMRPRLEFRGADTDGAARASGGVTNGSDPSARRQPPQDGTTARGRRCISADTRARGGEYRRRGG
jgi:hypothetical protein